MSETITNCMDPKYGPEYPELGATVAKLRRGKDRKAHGQAVLEAFLSKQKSALARATPSHQIHCASGTNHTTGKAILKAVAQQHRNGTIALADQIRRARTPEEWQEMYEAAMAEKRAREKAQALEPKKLAKLRRVK